MHHWSLNTRWTSRREALRVRFTADVEVDASEVGGGRGGEGEGGGGGGGVVEAGGEPMIFYTITYNNIQSNIKEKKIIRIINP